VLCVIVILVCKPDDHHDPRSIDNRHAKELADRRVAFRVSPFSADLARIVIYNDCTSLPDRFAQQAGFFQGIVRAPVPDLADLERGPGPEMDREHSLFPVDKGKEPHAAAR